MTGRVHIEKQAGFVNQQRRMVGGLDPQGAVLLHMDVSQTVRLVKARGMTQGPGLEHPSPQFETFQQINQAVIHIDTKSA
jgi:hypothetical protein